MRIVCHFLSIVILLAMCGLLQAKPLGPLRATPKARQAQVRKLLKRYSRAGSNIEQRERLVEEAIALGSPFTAALRAAIGRRAALDLRDYRTTFTANIESALRITPEGVLEESDPLSKMREELLRAAGFAYRLEHRLPDESAISGSSDTNPGPDDRSGFGDRLRQIEESLIQRWLDSKGYGRLHSAEAALVFEVNRVRAAKQLKPLEVDFMLSAVARDHSLEMARKRYFSHVSKHPGKKTFRQRAKRFGTSAAAENIASCGSAAEAMSLWMASSGHRKNILGATFTRVGIGRVGRKFTMMFGQ